MCARMPLTNSHKAMGGETFSNRWITQHLVNHLLHLFTILREEKIAARGEQIFRVVPGRADQRNATSECFERANRGNAGKFTNVRTPGNVQRKARGGEHFRYAVIGQPTTITNART